MDDIDNKFERMDNKDIFNTSADVLVVSANPMPKPAAECLEFLVYQKAGFDKMCEARKEIGRKDYGELFETDAFELKRFKKIYHVVMPRFHDACFYDDTMILADCYRKAIKLAVRKNMSSIVFPLLGSNSMYLSAEFAYDIARTAINQTLSDLKKDITVTLVLKNSRFLSDLNDLDQLNASEIENEINDEIERRAKIYGDYVREFIPPDLEEKYYRMRMKKELDEQRLMLNITNKIKSERDEYLAKNSQKTEENYYTDEFMNILNNWCSNSNNNTPTKLLSEALNVTDRTINNYRSGQKLPTKREKVIALALAMRLSREERIRFIIVGTKDFTYPKNINEKILENVVQEQETTEYCKNLTPAGYITHLDDILQKSDKIGKSFFYEESDPQEKKKDSKIR